MPVWPRHNRFVVRGSLGTGKEIWSNTLHFPSVITAGPDNNPPDWDEADVSTAVAAFYGSLNFCDSMKVTDWRGYSIQTTGKLSPTDTPTRHDYTTPIPGGAGLVKYPPQIAQVLSLHANARGPAQRGRIYLPMPTVSIDGGTFEMATVDAQGMLTAFKTYVNALLNAMYGSTTIGEGLINVSGGPAVGTLQKVTEIRMGRVLDTVRTRRNKLLEEYQVQTL